MNKIYFEEFRRRVTDDAPYAVFHRADVSYVAHIHEEMEVGFVVSGTVRVGGEAGDSLLNAGDIFVFMPDEIHSLSTVSPNKVEVLRLLPKQNDRVDFSTLRLKRNRVSPGEEGYNSLRKGILQMVKESDGNEIGKDMALRRCRYDIFLAVVRELKHEPIVGEEKKRLASQSLLLRKVNEYISEHYADPISLDEIARHCGYSKYYFSHCIKEATGSSFLDFLMLYRLSLACVRLRDRDGSVTEIAFDCGFNNLRSFNRMFRKYHHLTPTEYRKTNTEDLSPS
ncbi:MAG: helix-turn-helix transcriptional regulator [Clostridia bacterium]|nr:helix-turn-helix transcriptional regulator [Clostridia bacterium]